jgi:hypothetical protein
MPWVLPLPELMLDVSPADEEPSELLLPHDAADNATKAKITTLFISETF